MTDPLKNLCYPVEIRCLDSDFLLIAEGATTDKYVAIKEFNVGIDHLDGPEDYDILREFLDRKLSEAQMDQCARECRNLWGPIWPEIWREVWEHNSTAMAEERIKALKEYFG